METPKVLMAPQSRSVRIAIFAALSFLCADAAEWSGGLDLGYWYLKNNISSGSSVIRDDGIGNILIDDSYSLFIFNFRAKGEEVFTSTNFHVDARSLLNPFDNRYSLGADQDRLDIRQFAFEIRGDSVDVWAGRQRILEAGNIGVDGLRTVLHMNEATDLAFYGGIGNNPRNYTGYIGPFYEGNPFTIKLQTAGAYVSTRLKDFQFDAAFNSLFFEFKPDRVFLFTQALYHVNPKWSLSGAMQFSFKGYTGFETLQTSVITRPTKKFTNTLSFYRFVALLYAESSASVIPPIIFSDPALVGGTNLNTTSYYSVRDHFMLNVMSSNYVFGAVEFSKRGFDDRTRVKYTAGFRDPALFNSEWDLRVQTDLIQNYRGFNSVLDFLIGKEFSEGRFRIDTGVTLFSNERDDFSGNLPSADPRQTDEEYTLRFMATWIQTAKVAWNAHYNYHHEVDATNLNQDVNTHEFFIMSNFRL